MAAAAEKNQPAKRAYHHLPANADTVHWGYFSKKLKPQVEIDSGDFITIEALTHHANDDAERMVKGDPGVESVFLWTKEKKDVNRRGAGPMDASLFGRGAGEGLGVHICTGPVYVRGAQEGDVIELRIIDVTPRPCANPQYPGKAFGSNAAAWWGFHYNDLLDRTEAARGDHDLRGRCHRRTQLGEGGLQFPMDAADRSVRRRAQDHRLSRRAGRSCHGQGEPRHPEERADSDPSAFRRDWPGAQGSRHRRFDSAELYRRQHRQLADRQGRHDVLSGRGRRRPCCRSATPHASQGDSELCGTAIECSLNGTFQIILHKKADLAGTALEALDYPMLETRDEWLVHGFSFANYLTELGDKAQSDIYSKSSVDLALRDAFRKMRKFLMTTKKLTEDEAISLITIGVDFGITQVVDGNWGVHAVIKKDIFAGGES